MSGFDVKTADRSALNAKARELRISPAGKNDNDLRREISGKMGAATTAQAPAARPAPVQAPRPAVAAPAAPAAPAARPAARPAAAVPAPKAAPAAVQAPRPAVAAPGPKAAAPAPAPKAAPPVVEGPSVADVVGMLTELDSRLSTEIKGLTTKLKALEGVFQETAARVVAIKSDLDALAAAPAPEQESVELTEEWITSAGFPKIKAACAALKQPVPKNLAEGQSTLRALLMTAEAESGEVVEGEVVPEGSGALSWEELDYGVIAGMFGDGAIPLAPDQITVGMTVWVFAPNDTGLNDPNSDPPGPGLWRGSISETASGYEGHFVVDIQEEDGSLSPTDLPAHYLYLREEETPAT